MSNCSPHPSGLLRLDDFAALRVSGEDCVDFLQGQLSQDMGRVTPTQAAPAAWCNRQGRVLCLMVAVDWQDAIFLILPAAMAETCAEGLGRYVLRAKVRIERWDQAVFGCAGIEEPGAETWACKGNEAYCAVRLPGARNRALLLGEPPTNAEGAPGSGLTLENWRLADIEAELPWIGEKTSGKFLAHSLNLDLSGAVSFTKGCYVGQEIIARMEHRGRPKRRMQRVHLPADSAVEAGARVDHPEHGAATIITWSAAPERVEALAEVRLAQDGSQAMEQS
ncbi:MAG: hypothetical protein OXJ63_04595 [Gammaproteobacteria bacterium]|nr:hypothetical protein [Gammaproteobacteria bacterium]